MIIDFHTHAFIDKIAEGAIADLSAKCGEKPFYNGTLKGLTDSMEKAGVDISVVQSIATKPHQTPKINEWSYEINKLPNIIAFGSIHPDYEDWRTELHNIKAHGLKGIKFHPDYQGFFVDEDRMIPIYQEAFKLGLIVLFHAGVDIGLPKPTHCTPQRVNRVMDIFEGQKVVFAHMGAYDMWQDVEKYMAGHDFFIDSSFALSKMNREQAMNIIEKHGYNKILFGTDSPWTGQKEEIKFINEFGFSCEVKKALLGENAFNLLEL